MRRTERESYVNNIGTTPFNKFSSCYLHQSTCLDSCYSRC